MEPKTIRSPNERLKSLRDSYSITALHNDASNIFKTEVPTSENVLPEERFFPETERLIWNIIGFIALFFILTRRTILLTLISLLINQFGITRRTSSLLALLTVFLLPQHLFTDQDIYEDVGLAILENLTRSMVACLWSYAVVFWLTWGYGWRF